MIKVGDNVIVPYSDIGMKRSKRIGQVIGDGVYCNSIRWLDVYIDGKPHGWRERFFFSDVKPCDKLQQARKA